MTDSLPQPASPASGSGRRIRLALAVSVALNLAVAGLIGGLWLHDGPEGHGDIVRELGFGPFDEALRPEDRDVLKAKVRDHQAELKTARRNMQADAAAILAALRTDPFQPLALDAALKGQEQHLADRLKFGNSLIQDFLVALPQADRLEFADRLENHLRRGPGGGDGAPGN